MVPKSSTNTTRFMRPSVRVLSSPLQHSPPSHGFALSPTKCDVFSGGFAKVKLGRHILTGEKVAIKIINKRELGVSSWTLQLGLSWLKCSHKNIFHTWDLVKLHINNETAVWEIIVVVVKVLLNVICRICIELLLKLKFVIINNTVGFVFVRGKKTKQQ